MPCTYLWPNPTLPQRCAPSARSGTGPATKQSAGRPQGPAAAAVRRQQQPAISLPAGKRLASLPAEDANAVYSAKQRTRLALVLRKSTHVIKSKAAPERTTKGITTLLPHTPSVSAHRKPLSRRTARRAAAVARRPGARKCASPSTSWQCVFSSSTSRPSACKMWERGWREATSGCVCGKKGHRLGLTMCAPCCHGAGRAGTMGCFATAVGGLGSCPQPATPQSQNNLTCCSCRLRVTSRKLSSRSRRSERQP